MRVTCHFDGACGPESPGGHAGYGAIVRGDGKPLLYEAGYVGHGPAMTCNVAEYAGVVAVLKFLLANNLTRARIFGDSNLVIQQLNRKWKAKHGLYMPYYREAIILKDKLPNVELKWLKRDFNLEADALSKEAIARGGRLSNRPNRTPLRQSGAQLEQIDLIEIARQMQTESGADDGSSNPKFDLLFLG